MAGDDVDDETSDDGSVDDETSDDSRDSSFGSTRLERRLGALMALIVLGSGIVLTVWGISELRRDERLDRHGVEVPARLVRATVDDDSESTTTTVVVRFEQRGDARTSTTAEIVYDGDFEADHPDTRRDGVRIEYDPDDPGEARLVGVSHDRGTELLVGASIFAIVGAGIVGFTARAWKKHARPN